MYVIERPYTVKTGNLGSFGTNLCRRVPRSAKNPGGWALAIRGFLAQSVNSIIARNMLPACENSKERRFRKPSRGVICLVLLGLVVGCECGAHDASARTAVDNGKMGGGADAGTGFFADTGFSPQNSGDTFRSFAVNDLETQAAGGVGGELDGDLSSCFDGIDNDGSGAIDCDDPLCAGLAICCVDSTTCAEKIDAFEADFDCGATALCDTRVDSVVGDAPTLMSSGTSGSALYPSSGLLVASGVVYREPFDLDVARVRSTIRFGRADNCDATCGETIGLAIRVDGNAAVELVHRGFLGDVALTLFGETVASWKMENQEENWTLLALPASGNPRSSTVQVMRHALDLDGGKDIDFSVDVDLGKTGELMLTGRSDQSRTALERARAIALSTQHDLCDITDAWSDRNYIDLDAEQLAPELAAASKVDVLELSDQRLIAFSDGHSTTILEDNAGVVTLQKRFSASEQVFNQPDLFEHNEEVYLVLTQIQDGSHAVVLYKASDNFNSKVSQIDGVSHGSVTLALNDSNTVLMAALASHGQNSTSTSNEVHFYYSSNLVDWTRNSRLVLDRNPRSLAFASPQFGQAQGSVYRLFFGVRQNNVTSIFEAVSVDSLAWRQLGHPTLSPQNNGYEALGVSSPSAHFDGDVLTLYYLGEDGRMRNLMKTTRHVPTNPTLSSGAGAP